MDRSSRCRAAIILVVVILASMFSGRQAGAEDGQWSRLAIAVPSQRSFVIPSPDRKKTVRIEGFDLTVTEDGMPVPGGVNISILKPAEVLWAPDSRGFALTSSDGGVEGIWEVVVFLLENERLNYHDPGRDAAARFKQQHPCVEPLEPNIGAVKWLKESKQLLLILEAPPGTSCSERPVMGYAVEAGTGAVLKEYDRRKLIRDWGEFLGRRVGERQTR